MSSKIKKVYFWDGIQTIKVKLEENKIETNFENYFVFLYKKIRKRQIEFKKAKAASILTREPLPLWIRFIMIGR